MDPLSPGFTPDKGQVQRVSRRQTSLRVVNRAEQTLGKTLTHLFGGKSLNQLESFGHGDALLSHQVREEGTGPRLDCHFADKHEPQKLCPNQRSMM
jgi:hypothetical protein